MRRDDAWRRPALLSAALVLAAYAGWLNAQSVEVPLVRAGELKRVYPFLRFETLSDFAAPIAQPAGVTVAPHPVRGRAAAVVVPPDVLRLSGTRVSVRGYMLPLEAAAGGVTSFLLMKAVDSCHFGTLAGAANEWIAARVAAGRFVPYAPGRPVTAFGTLTVQPEYVDGTLSQLYAMRVDHLAQH